ncbi:Ig-like domain-containing protein [Phytomonospora endophytica]|uniref:LPXTG-motif cell wall-anchored protein n=1 Tax=Phytomonospora endophytica TaxID=714109 RepID=A0A841FHE8_9ACTN|nr:Ig-like domain-containing protein [Phytomonospora endophytica]MBB6033268.1 LPXTG-motif cell wall-anchored protein [Phytomonospora endophytica]GIG65494.1 hypothetical protein Pen01_17890 [Phytomonospora endophytica]
MKNLAPRTARLAGAGAAAFVLALAAPAMASADEKFNCTSKTESGLGEHTFQTKDSCSPAETLTITGLNWDQGLGTASEDDASVTVTGLPGVGGDLVVTADVENEAGDEAQWIITITLFDEPEVPQANNDSGFPAVKAGGSLKGNVKDNDGTEDVPAGDWDAVLVGEPGKGTVTLSANGAFTYKANANASGNDTFSYKLENDGESSNIATVSVKITAAGGGGGDDDGDDDGNNDNGGDNNNGGNNGTDNKADKDKLAKTGMSLPTVAVTGAGALGAGAVALWFTRRRKESGSAI